jgi:hypothetical protein|tara:strand:+ start:175 stop:510 length:336 start_codon:yes stop_codon:yes gene_type:complete
MNNKPYTKHDLVGLKKDLEDANIRAKQCAKDNDHKLQYSNSWAREHSRLRKLIKFIESNLKVQEYGSGEVLINDKFVVTLYNDNWRVLYKNKWYKHKPNVEHFIDNYILKG